MLSLGMGGNELGLGENGEWRTDGDNSDYWSNNTSSINFNSSNHYPVVASGNELGLGENDGEWQTDGDNSDYWSKNTSSINSSSNHYPVASYAGAAPLCAAPTAGIVHPFVQSIPDIGFGSSTGKG